MRPGASTWCFFRRQQTSSPPRLSRVIQQITETDPSLGVEIWAAPDASSPGPDGRELAEAARACCTLPYVTVHSRPQLWHWTPHGLREEITFSHRLGARTLVLHPSCLGLTAPDDRIDWPEVQRIADTARQAGIQLAVENVADSMACLDRILEEIGDDPSETNIGICLDVGHAAISSDAGRDSLANYLDRYAGSLIHVHLHDNAGRGDDHQITGDGTIHWASLLHQLAAKAYTGPAVLEVQDAAHPPQEAIRRSLLHLRSLV